MSKILIINDCLECKFCIGLANWCTSPLLDEHRLIGLPTSKIPEWCPRTNYVDPDYWEIADRIQFALETFNEYIIDNSFIKCHKDLKELAGECGSKLSQLFNTICGSDYMKYMEGQT